MRKVLQIAGICVLIACVGITTMGIVLAPAPSPIAAGEEWYPCMGHGCGCMNAQMCREHCCCYGARSRDMKPPVHAHHAGHGRSQFRMAVQSADCSGRLGWSTDAGLAWDVTPVSARICRFTMHMDKVIAHDDLTISLSKPAIDPPPPRC